MEEFFSSFCVARVCQHQLGFLVLGVSTLRNWVHKAKMMKWRQAGHTVCAAATILTRDLCECVWFTYLLSWLVVCVSRGHYSVDVVISERESSWWGRERQQSQQLQQQQCWRKTSQACNESWCHDVIVQSRDISVYTSPWQRSAAAAADNDHHLSRPPSHSLYHTRYAWFSVHSGETGHSIKTLWRPLLPYGHSYKASCAILG